MYSGTTLTKFSGCIIGAHQKFDRLARKQIRLHGIGLDEFPSIKEILLFEGKNGPDAIKRKSPAVDEPWHYFNPFDKQDTKLLDLIDDHLKQLTLSLKTKNRERASFEAAWLAHAITDGLTPAHHYPYEEKLQELRGGRTKESRISIKEKWVMPGDTRKEQLINNWKMWGSKGLITTHGMFEMGIATMIKPLQLKDLMKEPLDVSEVSVSTFRNYYIKAAREVAALDLYETYYIKGWTSPLASKVRHKLAPAIVSSISTAWLCAIDEAS